MKSLLKININIIAINIKKTSYNKQKTTQYTKTLLAYTKLSNNKQYIHKNVRDKKKVYSI